MSMHSRQKNNHSKMEHGQGARQPQQGATTSSQDNTYRMESVSTTHVDLYKVLGLTPSCSSDDIERAHGNLVKQYHPDKVRVRHNLTVIAESKRGNISDEKRNELDELLSRKIKDATEMYNMINVAYQRLRNDRAGYDAEHTTYMANVEDDFGSMRSGAKSFMDAQGTVASDADMAKFRAQWGEMNRRHGYTEGADTPMLQQELIARIREAKAQRDKMEIETRPDKIFDTMNNLDQFNAVFEKTFSQQNTGGDIQPFDSSELPSLGGGDSTGMYGELGQVDNLYADEAGGTFAPLPPQSSTRITHKDLENVTPSASTFSHNVKTEADRAEMNRRMKEYRKYGQELNNRTMGDFSTEIQYGGVVANLPSNQQERLERLEFAANPQQVARYRDLQEYHARRQRNKQQPIQSAQSQQRPLHMAPQVHQTIPVSHVRGSVAAGSLPHPAVNIPPPSIPDRPQPSR